MSLFRDLGRRLERFKREADTAADETATHECAHCGQRFHAEHEQCPDCGSDEIAERE